MTAIAERPRIERARMMNPEARRLWVRELEAYAARGLPFATGCLREHDGEDDLFDALGLLVRAYLEHGESPVTRGWDDGETWERGDDGTWSYRGQQYGLPDDVSVWAGLRSPNPFLDSGDPATTGTIAYLTDHGLEPRELAALIAAHL